MSSPEFAASPDTSAYVDLRVFDVTDQDVFEAGLSALQINLPEWTPNEGNVETLLLEGVALEVSEAVVAINRLPGATLDTLLLLAGVTRDLGAPPTATVTITVSDDTGHTIPGATRIYAPTITGTGVTVLLVEPPELIIPAGSTTGTIGVIADVNTDRSNGVPAGTQLQMASQLPFVESVVLATPLTDGRSPESDEQWRDRGVNRLSRLNETLVLPRHFQAAALEFPDVAIAVVVDNNDPSTGGSGDDPGHITVAVLGDGGANVSAPVKAVIEEALDAQAIAVLQVHVVDITIVTVTMSVQVRLSDSTDPAAVSQAVKDAVTAYVNPLAWTSGNTVRRNEIIALTDRVPGVAYVGTVTITGANGNGDYVLASASAVPRATNASVTVTII